MNNCFFYNHDFDLYMSFHGHIDFIYFQTILKVIPIKAFVKHLTTAYSMANNLAKGPSDEDKQTLEELMISNEGPLFQRT